MISGKDWRDHSPPLFKGNRILTLRDINTFQVACFVYKSMNNALPLSFNNYFVTNEYMHGHVTRRHGDIHIIRCNTKLRAFSVKIYGAKIWNSIPMSIRSAPSINIFKRKLKLYLFEFYT